jgi:hypothetical protein
MFTYTIRQFLSDFCHCNSIGASGGPSQGNEWEQFSYGGSAYSTESDIPWLITPRDIIFNPLDISSRT